MNKELIPLANGEFKQRKDIVVGDYLIGQNGEATKVLFTQLVKDVPTYQVTLNDGRQFTLGKDEYLGTRTRDTLGLKNGDMRKLRFNKIQIMAKDFFIYQTLKTGRVVRHSRYSLPMNESVHVYPKRTHVIAPYALGVLIAEGALKEVNSHRLTISSGELDVVHKFIKGAGLTKYAKRQEFVYDFIQRDNVQALPVMNEIIRLNLNHRTFSKFIPEEYLKDSVDNRMNLLKGLIDTDGTIKNPKETAGGYYIRYSTSSELLRNTFQELIRGLGFGCTTVVRAENKFQSINYNISVFTPQTIWSSQKHDTRVESNVKGYVSSKHIHSKIVDIVLVDERKEYNYIRVLGNSNYLVGEMVVGGFSR